MKVKLQPPKLLCFLLGPDGSSRNSSVPDVAVKLWGCICRISLSFESELQGMTGVDRVCVAQNLLRMWTFANKMLM